MIGAVDHFFMYLLATYISSLEKSLSSSLTIFQLDCLFFWCCSVVGILYIFQIPVFIRYMICKYFLPLCGLPFAVLIVSFDAQNISLLIKPNLSIFSSFACAFHVISKKSLPNPANQFLNTGPGGV